MQEKLRQAFHTRVKHRSRTASVPVTYPSSMPDQGPVSRLEVVNALVAIAIESCSCTALAGRIESVTSHKSRVEPLENNMEVRSYRTLLYQLKKNPDMALHDEPLVITSRERKSEQKQESRARTLDPSGR